MTPKPTILITGANGQLGRTIQTDWLESPLSERYELHSANREQLDISEPNAVSNVIAELKPDIIINASAYTGVDGAESDQDNAYLVNKTAVENLAQHCKRNTIRLIHISTDFVFSGDHTSPINPHAEANPAGVYGASKLAGEQGIMAINPDNSVIIRTSWLYSEFNNNFVKTMLRLMGEKDSLGVVNDQIGSPTSTHSLVRYIFSAVENTGLNGIYHWSDLGEISWYDFAIAIQEEGLKAGLLKSAIPLRPIATSEYPTPAQRPAYSVLDCSASITDVGVPQADWREELNRVIQQLSDLGE